MNTRRSGAWRSSIGVKAIPGRESRRYEHSFEVASIKSRSLRMARVCCGAAARLFHSNGEDAEGEGQRGQKPLEDLGNKKEEEGGEGEGGGAYQSRASFISSVCRFPDSALS